MNLKDKEIRIFIDNKNFLNRKVYDNKKGFYTEDVKEKLLEFEKYLKNNWACCGLCDNKEDASEKFKQIFGNFEK